MIPVNLERSPTMFLALAHRYKDHQNTQALPRRQRGDTVSGDLNDVGVCFQFNRNPADINILDGRTAYMTYTAH